MATAAVRRYWNRLIAGGCCICGRDAEIAHCHGGSVRDKMQEPKAKGKKLARYDWLVLPLCPEHGRNPYPGALDSDVAAWEEKHGTQVHHLDILSNMLSVDIWTLSRKTK